jgi:hypothetical protein
MKAEREWFDPAKRSILAKTSPDSVIDVFSFILLIYHPRRICIGAVLSAEVVREESYTKQSERYLGSRLGPVTNRRSPGLLQLMRLHRERQPPFR